MELSTDKIIAEKDGHIGWLTFNQPEKRNAVSLEMWQAVPTVLANFEADPAIRVIVLKGAGTRAFVAGADISEFESMRDSAKNVAYYNQQSGLANKTLCATNKPTIAMIRGVCVGGGVGITLNCDLRIASEDARFSVPAAKLGLGYGYGGLKQLVDIVGPAYAKEIFFTARLFAANEALAMGLINRVIPTNVLEAYVRDYCQTIAQNAPMTINAVKKIIAQIIDHDNPTDHEYCQHLVQECFDSEDYIEGRRAFMEKRKPVFKGR